MRDHEIIELYWARNESAIAATAEKYGNYCHTIAYNILRNKEDAEECANEMCLRDSLKAHLFAIGQSHLQHAAHFLAKGRSGRSFTFDAGYADPFLQGIDHFIVHVFDNGV